MTYNEWTEEEICKSYRNAGSTGKQISIIHQLTGLSSSRVRELLVSRGLIELSKEEEEKMSALNAELKANMKAAYDEGKTDAEIAAACGNAKSQVTAWKGNNQLPVNRPIVRKPYVAPTLTAVTVEPSKDCAAEISALKDELVYQAEQSGKLIAMLKNDVNVANHQCTLTAASLDIKLAEINELKNNMNELIEANDILQHENISLKNGGQAPETTNEALTVIDEINVMLMDGLLELYADALDVAKDALRKLGGTAHE